MSCLIKIKAGRIGTDTDNVEINSAEKTRFTQEEINSAMDKVIAPPRFSRQRANGIMV